MRCCTTKGLGPSSDEKSIEVPADVPVVTFKPADKSAIAKGAHVFVAGKAGNLVNAAMVALGLDGIMPPI